MFFLRFSGIADLVVSKVFTYDVLEVDSKNRIQHHFYLGDPGSWGKWQTKHLKCRSSQLLKNTSDKISVSVPYYVTFHSNLLRVRWFFGESTSVVFCTSGGGWSLLSPSVQNPTSVDSPKTLLLFSWPIKILSKIKRSKIYFWAHSSQDYYQYTHTNFFFFFWSELF